MAELSSVLARIPGLGGYLAQDQMNRQSEQGELAQLARAMQIKGQQQQMGAQEQAAQAQAAERARMEQYRAAVEGLGPQPTQEQLAQVAARFGGPDAVMRVQQSSLDRQATAAAAERARQERAAAQRDTLAQRAAEAEAARAQRIEELRMRLADRQTQAQERAALMRELAALRQQGAAVKPPAGYRPTKDGNLEAIPGGPADTKLQGALNQDTAMLTNTTAALDRLAVATNDVMNDPGLPKATGLMSAVPGIGGFATIPGTDAANFKAKLQTLKAQVGFGVLQEMRNASKTGGALGQVTEKELGFLQNALAALDTAQTEDEFRKALGKVLEYSESAKGRLRSAFNLKHGDRAQPGAASPTGAPSGLSAQEQAELEALRKRFGR